MKTHLLNLLAFFLLLVAPAASVQAQSVADAMNNYKTASAAHTFVSMDVEVLQYASAQTRTGTRVGTGMMRMGHGAYYSKFMNDELLSIKNKLIILNHAERRMILMTELEQQSRQRQFVPDSDSLLHASDSSVYKGVSNGEEVIELYSKSGDIRKTIVRFNTTTHLINRISYFYAPSDQENDYGAYKTEVIYTKISFEPIDKSFFDENRFVQFKNKRWSPAAAFSNYKLNVTTPAK